MRPHSGEVIKGCIHRQCSVSLSGVIVQSTGLHSVQSTLQFSVLALYFPTLSEHCIAPWHVVQSEYITNLCRKL